MRNAITLALTALVVFLLASGWLALYPAVPHDLEGARDLNSIATRVRIPVGEDALDGWLLRGSRPGVIVLFAGYARDHARMWRYAQFLRRDGWSLLAIDFRSARAHDRKPTTLGYWEMADARATLDWLEGAGGFAGQRIGLFGESLGGSVAIALAAERREVTAIGVDSPFATGQLAIEDGCRFVAHVPVWPAAPLSRWLGRSITGHDPSVFDVLAAERALQPRPLLLIQSGREDRFGLEQVRLLAHDAGANAELWLVTDAGHNQAWLGHREEYERRVRAFFVSHMAAPSGRPVRGRGGHGQANHTGAMGAAGARHRRRP